MLADKAGRARKALKIGAVLKDGGVQLDGGLSVLDIGSSYGHILNALATNEGYCVGLDLDMQAGWIPTDNIGFLRGDAEKLPFPSNCFDVVICNHVYEHTDNATALVAEIYRVLKQAGACYFAGPNKYDVIEPHYRLPFLSWLPKGIADRYVRFMQKGVGYPEKPLSWFALRRLLSQFEVQDYTSRILRDPVKYCATDLLIPGSAKHLIAKIIFRLAPFLFPSYVFVLRKRP